jgi:hypothetical protein
MPAFENQGEYDLTGMNVNLGTKSVVGEFELTTGDQRQNQNWERTGVPARGARVGWS